MRMLVQRSTFNVCAFEQLLPTNSYLLLQYLTLQAGTRFCGPHVTREGISGVVYVPLRSSRFQLASLQY